MRRAIVILLLLTACSHVEHESKECHYWHQRLAQNLQAEKDVGAKFPPVDSFETAAPAVQLAFEGLLQEGTTIHDNLVANDC